jgi:hypothetical protein
MAREDAKAVARTTGSKGEGEFMAVLGSW